MLYSNSGTTSLDGLYVINSISSDVNYNITSWYKSYYLNFSLLIFSIGFLFKVGAAPFHFWSPDTEPGKFCIVGSIQPNSENPLELQVPSHNVNIMSGWANHEPFTFFIYKKWCRASSGRVPSVGIRRPRLCMVTSLKASESNVGNCGSKSVILNNIAVKEPRVYGCICGMNLSHIRCNLTGFERNYLVKNHPNLIIQRRLYSIECSLNDDINKLPQLNEPWFVSGFTDAEGCFMVLVRKSPKNRNPDHHLLEGAGSQSKSLSTLTDANKNNTLVLNPGFVTGFTDGEGCFLITAFQDNMYKSGWRVKLFYQLHLHIKDLALLGKIKDFFGGAGKLYTSAAACKYYVYSEKDLSIIIKHFGRR